MARHLTRDELEAGLAQILASPKDTGRIEALVVRPGKGERREVESVPISLAGGVEGDHWAKGCWKTTEDGQPHPDVQICMMNARCLDLVAQGRERWALAGDNVIVDMDLSPENLAPGQRLAVGSAVIEITDTAHTGCQKFIDRFGRDACLFVNTGAGRKCNLRGIYARVVKDGVISVGDRITKIG